MARKGVTFIAALALGLTGFAVAAQASTEAKEPKHQNWTFEGPFGQFDQAQLQRGFKVYQEVCSACHSMSLLSYRNLADKGGPFYDPKYGNPNESPYAKAIAAGVTVADIDSETGDAITRPATTADRFKAPFPNEAAARASNGGAYPPDLSVIAKAREGGPSYIYSILTGYETPPKGLMVPPGKYYNAYLPGDLSSFMAPGAHGHAPEGGLIAMPPPLKPGLVTFDDGTASTVNQQARDVAAFLMWAAEPKMEERKQMGFGVMIFLILLAGVVYASYRRIWRNVAH
jgi:ubiquinol-cytochrome c reductase cytochrome c1 subunit